MIKHVIIIHLHELTLKGRNRSWFEKTLIKNIKIHLSKLPYSSIKIIAGRIFVSKINISKWKAYQRSLQSLIGIRNFVLSKELKLDIELMKEESLSIIKASKKMRSFRISSRRQNKKYIYTSYEINNIVGQHIKDNVNIDVNLSKPDINVLIEIVNENVYIGINKIDAYGGLPIGTGETGLSLISSGIDSPVSSFNILKRGVTLDYIHFHSSPATTKQSIFNVESILEVLCKYQMRCKLYLFPLLSIQNIIMEKADSKYWVLLFRRTMVKIASKIAENNNYKVLISGENIGQVASQTLSNIVAIQDAIDIPIIRPLAGYNKEEIVNQAEKIGTYDISIEPYQDCCSYFVPSNPETKADINKIHLIEEKIDIDKLIINQMNNIEIKEISYYE